MDKKMKSLILAVLLAPAAFGGERTANVRFMAFNIWGDYFHNPACERMDGVLETICARQPDVIALQEVTTNWWNCGLFEKLGDRYEVVRGNVKEALRLAGSEVVKPEAQWGNYEPLLYRRDRFRALETGLEFFHLYLESQKSVTWAVLEDKKSGIRFVAFSTHLWYKGTAESEQIREMSARRIAVLMESVRAKWGNISVVGGGDFNSREKSLALHTLGLFGYKNAGLTADETSPLATIHDDPARGEDGKWHGQDAVRSTNAKERIDHVVYLGKMIRALRHEVVTDRSALDVSDHSPIQVDFVLIKNKTR